MAPPRHDTPASPRVKVSTQLSGGFRVHGSILLPGCTQGSVYQSLTDFGTYQTWNPAMKDLRVVRSEVSTKGPVQLSAPTTQLEMVQHVSCLAFKRVFTSLVEAEECADKRSVRFRMVSSGLYHDYGCTFVVEPLEAPAPANACIAGGEAGAAPAPNNTKAGVESQGTDHSCVGAKVQYTGHFRMKVAPPPPLSRMLVPRALHSGTVAMLSKLQTRVSRPA